MIFIIKREFKVNAGWIKSYVFKLFGKPLIIAVSETKWHAGEKYKKMPIWVSKLKEGVPAVFIWTIAIGLDLRKK